MEHLIIDTDPGVDDALAILAAAAHPNATIEALLVVAGNVGLHHTTTNAGVIVDLIQRDIPIYAGCGEPLVLAGESAAHAHGDDGLGGTGLTSTRRPEPLHASLALLDMVNREPGKYTLVALGPLTNIALTLKLDPALPHKLKRCVMMAGAVSAHGNMQLCTEFNVYADPEAAHVVFEAWGAAGRLIELIDWEVTMRYGFTEELVTRWAALGTPKADFFTAVSAHVNRFIREHRRRTTQYYADPVAMAVVLEPEIVTAAEEHYVAVELNGRYARGQTITDWQDLSGHPLNCRIIMTLNGERMWQLVENGLR